MAPTEPPLPPPLPLPVLPRRVHLSGIEFIAFAADKPSRKTLANMLTNLCFRAERQHVYKAVELLPQGAIDLAVKSEAKGCAAGAFAQRGPPV
ncbi:MAG: hypothetical protein KJN93_05525 [Alphaproteobacteria bacterium]|nr:hypothetical protein [Alphaproteobacteria bacterium]